MSFSIEHARGIAASLELAPIPNLIAQAKAKQLLKEVRELPENYPRFTLDLDERITFVAYRKLAVGCSLAEQEFQTEGQIHLHSAGDLLEGIHRSFVHVDRSRSISLLGRRDGVLRVRALFSGVRPN